MYKLCIFYLTFTTLFFSCGGNDSTVKKSTLLQPKVLEKNSEFDIYALTFNEDVRQLFSKSLDTIGNEYSLKNLEPALSPDKEKLEYRQERDRFVIMPEERYFFQSFSLDSIATLEGIYFNKVDIETNKDLKITTFIAYSDFYSTQKLDTALHKLYIKYGKTLRMKKQEEFNREYDSLRGITRYKPKNYEKYLYEYKQEGYAYSGEFNYTEWVLDDRVLQVKIHENSEMKMDLITGEIDQKNFHTFEFLSIKKQEYDSIKSFLFENMKKYGRGFDILKPYEIKSLNYRNDYSSYTYEMDRIKQAEMKAKYLRYLEGK